MKKEIDVELVRKLARESNSKNELAKKLNVSWNCVDRILNKYDIQIGGTPKNAQIDIPLEEIKEGLKVFGSLRKFATHKGVSIFAVLNNLRRQGYDYQRLVAEIQNEIAPDITEDIINVDGDGGVLIMADNHCPFISLEWHNRAIKYARKYKIKKLVIGGDFWDFDRLSFWLRQANAIDMGVALEDELSFSEIIVNDLLNNFNEIYILGGNHWRRLLNHITYSIRNERLMRLAGFNDLKKVRFSTHYDWLLIDNKVRVTHPKHARKMDGTLARDIAIKNPNQWIVVTHRHRGMYGFTPDGRPMIEIGWLGDVNRMRYYQHIDTAYYNWVNGFAVYQNGILQNLFEYNFDWSSL